MMAIELHDLDGSLIMVNFLAVFFMRTNIDNTGTVLVFQNNSVEVKESVEEIMRNVKTFAMQNQLRGH